MRVSFLLMAAASLSACNMGGGGPRVEEAVVQPGLASCLTSIGRPDVAVEPDADMSTGEIEALIACTADRAGS